MIRSLEHGTTFGYDQAYGGYANLISTNSFPTDGNPGIESTFL
jgi:hypothetical protein